MAKKKMMPYMEGYSNSYIPPKGNAGAEGRGNHVTKGNPRSVPKKGSSISSASEFGRNADREKLMGMKNKQAKNESLRGVGC